MNNKYNLKYNHTMEVINPMNNQLRPFSGRPTTGRPTTSKPNVEIEIESNSNSLKNITESEDIESSNSVSSKEKFEFLDSVVGGKQKENFENLIKEEADRIDMINKQKANLKNINLIEKNMNVKLNKYTLIEVCGNEDIKSSENKDKFGYAKM